MNILVAPAHYLFSDKVKSEPAWSFALVKHLGPLVKSMDVLTGVNDLNSTLAKNIKIFPLFKSRSNNLFIEFLRHMAFYPLITFQALKLIKKNKYLIIHHMLPLSYATLNPLIFIAKIFSPKAKVILGPLQMPQIQSDEQDLNVVYIGKTNYSIMSKLVHFLTMMVTSLVKPISKLMFEKADLVVCNSQTSLKHYSQLFPKAKFAVIPTGMDAIKVNTSKTPKDNKKIRIMCTGVFSKRKGQIFLLKAFNKLIKKFPNIELTLIGGGDQDDVYRSFVKKNKLDKYVKFTGQIPYSDLLAAYRNHDIFCLPTLSDTSPYVILEAMTFGLPIVASNVGSIKEMVSNAGESTKPGDIKSLEVALSKLVSNPELRLQMGKLGIIRVENNYTWDTISKQWLNLYKRLLP